MEPAVQRAISGAKDALPARPDVQDLGGEARLGDAWRELQAAVRAGTLIPAQDSFHNPQSRAAASELVWRYWLGESDAERTTTALVRLPLG
jgi:hypothetical protein